MIRYHFPPMSDTDPRALYNGGPNLSGGTISGSVWRRYFGSSHTGGLNAVFCDGSVRFVKFAVDPAVWMYSIVLDDGMPFNGDQL